MQADAAPTADQVLKAARDVIQAAADSSHAPSAEVAAQSAAKSQASSQALLTAINGMNSKAPDGSLMPLVSTLLTLLAATKQLVVANLGAVLKAEAELLEKGKGNREDPHVVAALAAEAEKVAVAMAVLLIAARKLPGMEGVAVEDKPSVGDLDELLEKELLKAAKVCPDLIPPASFFILLCSPFPGH